MRTWNRMAAMAWLGVMTALVGGCAASPAAGGPEDRGGGVETGDAIGAKVAGLRRVSGLLTLHVDDEAGSVWLELPAPDAEGAFGSFIYVESLRGGLGSNPVGLDRGQLGDSRLVTLREAGGKVFVEQSNLRYRARTDDEYERRAVRESFASSVLWAGEVAARGEDGGVLVDFTSFVTRDAHDVASRLRGAGQGAFSLDASRSAVETGDCLAFPDNVELEATLTFSSVEPGGEVRRTAPEPTAVTLRVHHSFVRLPDDGYTPRRADPRAPSFSVGFLDYAAGLDEPVYTQWIVRHRLERVDASVASGPVKEPIVYYVDRGAPEPIRSALIEGASWWADAFEAAGFEDAFRVEVMPEGAHPLDVRYNVIQWVHRSTRGWSYGGSVVDPRTGEILKGHVSLGSLRVRQDRMIFEGLAGTADTGTGAEDDPIELSLARVRQLAAHEVGHTLGFAHNFAASCNDRASVMDYPAPLVRVGDDGLDFSEAYAVGIGSWDVDGVRYAYSEFAPDIDEEGMLDGIIRDWLDRGQLYLSDADARPLGAAHPLASLWDNGDDPVGALGEALAVRAVAMENFGEGNIAEGEPLAALQAVFVPVYLYHRYQLEAATKSVGGVMYAYAVRGDGQGGAEAVPADVQRWALMTILTAMEPRVLVVPDRVVDLLLPATGDDTPGRERLATESWPTFDPVAASGVGADLVISTLLEPSRCARLIEQHRRDPMQLGLGEVLDALVDQAMADDRVPAHEEIRRQVQRVLVERLVGLAQNGRAAFGVRSAANGALRGIVIELVQRDDPHAAELVSIIERHLARPFEAGVPVEAAEPAPPGSPIGGWGPPFGECGWGG